MWRTRRSSGRGEALVAEWSHATRRRGSVILKARLQVSHGGGESVIVKARLQVSHGGG